MLAGTQGGRDSHRQNQIFSHHAKKLTQPLIKIEYNHCFFEHNQKILIEIMQAESDVNQDLNSPDRDPSGNLQ